MIANKLASEYFSKIGNNIGSIMYQEEFEKIRNEEELKV